MNRLLRLQYKMPITPNIATATNTQTKSITGNMGLMNPIIAITNNGIATMKYKIA